MSRLENACFNFFRRFQGPFLLGLSGGPDSKALFHLLLENNIPFEVAHIDHGWRETSGEEAEQLAEQCKKLKLIFHLLRLNPSEIVGNLEDGSRIRRLQFFREVCQKRALKGVILGHHADDQAEVVLKRLFEGASLPKLGGMEISSTFEGLSLLRPLLPVKKNDILLWLKEREIPYFEDETNNDTRFLRGKCRTILIPMLSESFGKEIATSLCRLSDSVHELNEFLKEFIDPYRKEVQEDKKGVFLDFGKRSLPPTFIWKAVVRDLFDKQKITLPSSVLETIVDHLQKKSIRKKIRVGKHQVCLDRGTILIESIVNEDVDKIDPVKTKY